MGALYIKLLFLCRFSSSAHQHMSKMFVVSERHYLQWLSHMQFVYVCARAFFSDIFLSALGPFASSPLPPSLLFNPVHVYRPNYCRSIFIVFLFERSSICMCLACNEMQHLDLSYGLSKTMAHGSNWLLTITNTENIKVSSLEYVGCVVYAIDSMHVVVKFLPCTWIFHNIETIVKYENNITWKISKISTPSQSKQQQQQNLVKILVSNPCIGRYYNHTHTHRHIVIGLQRFTKKYGTQ